MESKMRKTLTYIEETLGIQPTVTHIAKSHLDRLPMYIHETVFGNGQVAITHNLSICSQSIDQNN